jgi:hypothetical protein
MALVVAPEEFDHWPSALARERRVQLPSHTAINSGCQPSDEEHGDPPYTA